MIMDPSEKALCSNCRKPGAGTHLTSIHHGIKESRFLCESCLPSAGPPVLQDFVAKMKNSVCRFCSGKGVTPDPLARILDVQEEPRFLCVSCSSEYLRIGSERLAVLDGGTGKDTHTEQMKKLQAAAKDIEAHMEKWVIQRNN
jgi:hypothetical protein